MDNQCAVGPEGQLLDASKIDWYNDPDDAELIQAPPAVPSLPTASTSTVQDSGPGLVRSRPVRVSARARLAEVIAAEKLDEFGKPMASTRRLNPPSRLHAKHKQNIVRDVVDSDPEDKNFGDTEVGSESDDSEGDCVVIPNEELADMLPSKTIPSVNNRKGHALKANNKVIPMAAATAAPAKKRARTPESEDAKEVNADRTGWTAYDTGARNTTVSPASSFQSMPPTKRVKGIKKSPVYLFYEIVANGADGTPGDDGDIHYRCLHGAHKICTIKRSMRCNLNVLVNNLRVHVGPMHQLYCLLKERAEPPTPTEIAVATGKRRLDGKAESEFLEKLYKSSENIKKAFQDQQTRAIGPWDQERFEQALTEWMVACDQPFTEVEKPEFIAMMHVTHHSGGPFKIPKQDAIKRRVMKMGTETIEGIRAMFQALEGKVSLSLDAWTSSNQHAFMAIVAHYVTNNGHLEELLIDFQELIGEHSGENMADAVWGTLEQYGLVGRVIAIVMDNASNNNTMMASLQRRHGSRHIKFSAQEARMRCMPHTIHLAAIKLLEGIGALSKSEGKKAAARSGNYQDNISIPLDREHDNDAVADNDDEPHPWDEEVDVIVPAVERLRKIIKHIRSSPQRRQGWVREHQFLQDENKMNITMDDCKASQPLVKSESPRMPILDVRTRWSSTHQMLRCALDYRATIDSYASRNKELLSLELSDEDWESLNLVASWLESFRIATLEMSTTKTPMISTTHAIFRGLQDDIKDILWHIPDSASPNITVGLTDAHLKLSDYYYQYDASPFYIWAALLDPRISYRSLKEDYADDSTLLSHLERSKEKLKEYFDTHYMSAEQPEPLTASSSSSSSSLSPTGTTSLIEGLPRKSFTARYRRKEKASVDELEEYFKQTREDFDSCNPIQWWVGRRGQFPRLFQLARDILCIPGSAVAVERIFSGGRDTISLRRASLHADTIRVLMLVKKRLHLNRTKPTAHSRY